MRDKEFVIWLTSKHTGGAEKMTFSLRYD